MCNLWSRPGDPERFSISIRHNRRSARMSTPQYDSDEEEMPERVAIVTGGASGMLII